ncbi:uncharacterized protein MONOS_5313 [Monocercomonoides exilis]|uniref:uncharacterized protein n=1 Tax=Monocercomonoides exilis TaxID=2049356 RepID=UPI003559897D|nr:hypothetical protein MONOS_5313 [Monocercomonoides exilis]|eukprot:MONOS_5313.1-p1 / transcript=MONOS_5313.1 / gene=MONOS_5313 / organism=Monocercomonoides_exilis_PA203 / gene_product=unspecified product / transcript_product=unspecified product / location=Mono_scaffold00153:35425-36989(-) / protein_length=347 / sequence_SO=supercontig / SO=protein_coding / is_pseudo=false
MTVVSVDHTHRRDSISSYAMPQLATPDDENEHEEVNAPSGTAPPRRPSLTAQPRSSSAPRASPPATCTQSTQTRASKPPPLPTQHCHRSNLPISFLHILPGKSSASTPVSVADQSSAVSTVAPSAQTTAAWAASEAHVQFSTPSVPATKTLRLSDAPSSLHTTPSFSSVPASFKRKLHLLLCNNLLEKYLLQHLLFYHRKHSFPRRSKKQCHPRCSLQTSPGTFHTDITAELLKPKTEPPHDKQKPVKMAWKAEPTSSPALSRFRHSPALPAVFSAYSPSQSLHPFVPPSPSSLTASHTALSPLRCFAPKSSSSLSGLFYPTHTAARPARLSSSISSCCLGSFAAT